MSDELIHMGQYDVRVPTIYPQCLMCSSLHNLINIAKLMLDYSSATDAIAIDVSCKPQKGSNNSNMTVQAAKQTFVSVFESDEKGIISKMNVEKFGLPEKVEVTENVFCLGLHSGTS